MIELAERITLPVTGAGSMPVHVVRPPAERRNGGAMLVFQDAYGVNEQLLETAARFADLGLLAVVPELFHRAGEGIVAGYDDDRNPRRIAGKDSLTVEGMLADITATSAWILAQPGIRPDALAAIGFCMGGRTAYLANGVLPLRAGVSFYASHISPELDAFAVGQHGPLLMFWAGRDRSIPPAMRRATEDALEAAGKRHAHVLFSQTEHGFFGHRRVEFDPEAAHQAWALTTAFLQDAGLPLSAPSVEGLAR